MKRRLVVGVSGASGAPLAIELLQQLKYRPEVETHLILTKGGEMTLHQETGMSTEEFQELADVVHDNANIITDNKNGFIFPTRDVNRLAEIILDIYKYQDRLVPMKLNCIQSAQAFLPSVVIRTIAKEIA